MRNLSTGVLGGLVAMFCFAGAANASATVDLIWQGNGTVTTVDSSSSFITLDIIITSGAQGIKQYSFDVDYTSVYDAGGSVSALTDAAGVPLNLGVAEATDNGTGVIEDFSGADFFGPGLPPASTYLAGTITFHVGPGAGTFTVAAFLGVGNGFSAPGIPPPNVPVVFNSAQINHAAVPEPGTAALLALGLGGLAIAGRRR